jgi:hypothetical protein
MSIENDLRLDAYESIAFLACLTSKEFDRVWYDGSRPFRARRLPPIPTLLESWKPGLTREGVVARRNHMFRTITDDIRNSRVQRGVCPDCGVKSCVGVHR